MSSDAFRNNVIAMAKAKPNLRVSTVVALALALESVVPNLYDAQALGAWARLQPEIAPYLADGKKINAIKELRGLTNASLLQAKDAIEAIR